MSIRFKKIYKVNNSNNNFGAYNSKMYLRDTTTSGTTGPDQAGTPSSTALTNPNYNKYIINWWVTDLASQKNLLLATDSREINQFVQPWPAISYTQPNNPVAAFSYLCWSGEFDQIQSLKSMQVIVYVIQVL